MDHRRAEEMSIRNSILEDKGKYDQLSEQCSPAHPAEVAFAVKLHIKARTCVPYITFRVAKYTNSSFKMKKRRESHFLVHFSQQRRQTYAWGAHT